MTNNLPLTDRASERPIAAIERGLAVLDAFLDGTPTRSVPELAAQTGLSPASVARILATLEAGGYAQPGAAPDARAPRWQVGPMPLRLTNRFRQGMQLEDIVPPILRELVRATGESASYFVARGRLRINLYRVLSPQAVRDHGAPGDVAPRDSGAAGAVFRTHLRVPGSAGAAARRPLVLVRPDLHPGMTGMASPVFGPDAECVGAIALTGPSARFDRAALARWQPLLRAAARTLTERIGGDGRRFG